MKKITSVVIAIALLFALAVTPTMAEISFSDSAVDFVKKIKMGFNLGNTFENTGKNYGAVWDDTCTVTDIETAANNPVTTYQIINTVRNAGFNAVRIPVSWYRWVDDENDFKIRDEWMDRIEEVVGYCYANNMYVIVNMHHDDKAWLDITKSGEDWEAIRVKYIAIWKQIADRFKNYDDHLILEAGNEIIANNDWWGQNDEYFDKINQLYFDFMNVVRNSGGYNDERYVMLPTYGAQWYEHQWGNLNIPDDHTIVDIHWYSETTDPDAFEQNMRPICNKLIKNGVAVVFGETGVRKEKAENFKCQWANAYYYTATKYQIPVFLWDDGGWYQNLNRYTLEWTSDGLVDEIKAAINGKEPVRTTQPTTAPYKPITENVDHFEATSDVFYSWASLGYAQTEGWQSGAVNLQSVSPRRASGGIRFQLENFKSQQLNCTWKPTADERSSAKSAVSKAKSGSGYLIFTVKVAVARDGNGNPCAVNIKHNINGDIPDNLLPSIKEGETKKILIRVPNELKSSFVLQVQNFQGGLSELDVTISKITVAQRTVTETTAPTVAPTTSLETETDINIPTSAPTVPSTAKPSVSADINGDGVVNVEDAQLALAKIADNEATGEFTEKFDLNADGKFDMSDLRILVLYVVNK